MSDIKSRDVNKEPIMVGDKVIISEYATVTDITESGFYWVRIEQRSTDFRRVTRSEMRLVKQEVRSDR